MSTLEISFELFLAFSFLSTALFIKLIDCIFSQVIIRDGLNLIFLNIFTDLKDSPALSVVVELFIVEM